MKPADVPSVLFGFSSEIIQEIFTIQKRIVYQQVSKYVKVIRPLSFPYDELFLSVNCMFSTNVLIGDTVKNK